MSKYLELVEGSFAQEHYEKTDFSKSPYVGYSKNSDSVIYSVYPKYGIKYILPSKLPKLEYHEVDLGLPSGLKWADRNVGADSINDFGAFFKWGDTTGYIYTDPIYLSARQLGNDITSYEDMKALDDSILADYGTRNIFEKITVADAPSSWDDYIWSVSTTYFDEVNQQEVTDYKLTKYCYTAESGLNGFVDNNIILDPEDDAATVHMGADWRMPTKEEVDELINNTYRVVLDAEGNRYCCSEDSGENPENLPELESSIIPQSVQFISKTNGEYITFPTTAAEFFGVWIESSRGISLWTSQLILSEFSGDLFGGSLLSGRAYYYNHTGINFDTIGVGMADERFYQHSVRGVKA